MEKLRCAKYSKGPSCGGQNNINLITYNDKISIPQRLQKYVVKLYHIYLLHHVWDQTKKKISNIHTGLELENPSIRMLSIVRPASTQNGKKGYF